MPTFHAGSEWISLAFSTGCLSVMIDDCGSHWSGGLEEWRIGVSLKDLSALSAQPGRPHLLCRELGLPSIVNCPLCHVLVPQHQDSTAGVLVSPASPGASHHIALHHGLIFLPSLLYGIIFFHSRFVSPPFSPLAISDDLLYLFFTFVPVICPLPPFSLWSP